MQLLRCRQGDVRRRAGLAADKKRPWHSQWSGTTAARIPCRANTPAASSCSLRGSRSSVRSPSRSSAPTAHAAAALQPSQPISPRPSPGLDRRALPMVLAVTEPSGQYQYPAEVKFEIRQNVKADYARAAEFVNYSSVRLVSVQHEYGIFGGDDGGYILDFVRALRVPIVVTLHTVSNSRLGIRRRLSTRCSPTARSSSS